MRLRLNFHSVFYERKKGEKSTITFCFVLFLDFLVYNIEWIDTKIENVQLISEDTNLLPHFPRCSAFYIET